MTWEQKFDAMQSLVGWPNISLRMRKPGDWYVNAQVEIGGDGLVKSTYGNGSTPEKAVEATWVLWTSLTTHQHLRVRDRCVRWVGYMWQDVL